MFVCSMLLCYLPQRAPLQCKNRPQGKRTTVFTHFSVCRTRLWLMSDNALFPQLSAVSAACPNSRAALLAAEIQNVYGTVIGTTLRTPFAVTAFTDLDTGAVQTSEAMSLPWMCTHWRTFPQTSKAIPLRRPGIHTSAASTLWHSV